jgi:glycosyltransferase involved in cell wall biosynthesis
MRDCQVIHPGVQHSASVASALDTAGRLISLTTCLQVGVNPRAPWSWLLRNARVRQLMDRRYAEHLDDHRIVRLGAWTLPFERLGYRWMGARVNQRLVNISMAIFQFRTARRLDPRTRIAIGTDTASSVLFMQLRESRPDVLRVLDASHPPLSAVRRLLSEDCKSHGLRPEDYDDYRPPDRRSEHAAIRETELADRILVASRFTAELYEAAGVPTTKLRVVPYAAPAVAPKPNIRSRDGLQLVFVGAISERKGISTLLHAMSEMERRRVPVRLDIVGKVAGQYELPPKLPSNVTFHGAVPNDEVVRLITKAHLLVLPSMCEGFGRVLLEALSLGTGIVSTTTSGAPDLRERAPAAPIWIVHPSLRTLQLPGLLEELSAKAQAGEIDPDQAMAAARIWSMDAYIRALDAATSYE